MSHAFPVRLAVGFLLLPVVALASSVYLNGVNIDGVTNQKFEKATVRIDERGNVFVEAAGYAVKSVEGGGHSPSKSAPSGDEGPGKLTKRYFLVTEQSSPGMTEFDIDVYVNAKWIRKLKNNEDQIVSEVTRYLTPGKNTVLLTARKVASGERRSFSPDHLFKVIIGEGNVGGDNVMIDNPLVTFKRTAAEGQDVSEEFTLTTR